MQYQQIRKRKEIKAMRQPMDRNKTKNIKGTPWKPWRDNLGVELKSLRGFAYSNRVEYKESLIRSEGSELFWAQEPLKLTIQCSPLGQNPKLRGKKKKTPEDKIKIEQQRQWRKIKGEKIHFKKGVLGTRVRELRK